MYDDQGLDDEYIGEYLQTLNFNRDDYDEMLAPGTSGLSGLYN